MVTGTDLPVSDRGYPLGALAYGTYVARAGVLDESCIATVGLLIHSFPYGYLRSFISVRDLGVFRSAVCRSPEKPGESFVHVAPSAASSLGAKGRVVLAPAAAGS